MKQLMQSLTAAALLLALTISAAADGPRMEFQKGDHVAIIGNTLADRMQHYPWLETYLHALHPEHQLTFRNLGFPGDELKTRLRAENFGSPDEWMTKVQADVVFCFFGYNEALKGEAGLPAFRQELSETIDGMLGQKYNGESAPQLVFFSPIARENLRSPHLPDGVAQNAVLEKYTAAMKEVCEQKRVTFVDIFHPTLSLYAGPGGPLTMNGVHLEDQGYQALAELIVKDLFAVDKLPKPAAELDRLYQAIEDKNYHWFSRYRVVDEYNVFGGRSKLEWFGQSNADVMMREMEIFDVKTANRDQRIWAVAKGGDLVVKDDNLPDELVVKPNKIGPLEGGAFPYLGGQEAISKMTVHEGLEVNLFASEEQFPRLANPVQMAVDTDSRLWVSVWPSYPHWNPTEPRQDALLIFPDENRDGVADECIVFADELNSVTGFEFWNGGVLVAALPELWYLKDTDGDNKADLKIRMLQGLSSADTHHSANAMLVGPDGWVYWSRGIFNTAQMETPTKTYRSTSSGVHRFNPRTFEIEYHFPIGPNPHGDVFDQWGYQFAGDGTSGTGSYVNIGKGVGNKQWYVKRVRPVAATGILSSEHFPEKFQGNFLISNVIGVLGVLQHEVKYNGADITAEEIDPIVLSDDPNFRPSDLEIGGDGALYVCDWHNTLIGHMQHNMRDPNRDHIHGRIYRITAKGQPLMTPAKLKGKPIAQVCDNFYSKTNNVRYRARLELTSREASEIVAEIPRWIAQQDAKKPGLEQALLECLWVFEEQRIPNGELLTRVFAAKEPRVRAAAIRALGHWGDQLANWEALLIQAAQDGSALVRAEAVKAAVEFAGATPAEVIFEVSVRPVDPELDFVLNYAKGKINVDQTIREAIAAGRPLSRAAQVYTLRNASVEDLLKMERTEAVYEAILKRTNAPADGLLVALNGLAKLRNTTPLPLLLGLLAERDRDNQSQSVAALGRALVEQPAAELKANRARLEDLATDGKTEAARRAGYAAWIMADGSGQNAFFAASKSKETLRDLLAAIPTIPDPKVRESLYPDVRSLMFELPPNLKAESTGASLQQPGIRVDYFHPSAENVAAETLAKMTPKASGIVPRIVMDVPQLQQRDQFALRFSGMIHAPKAGKYTFWVASDDGSRIYLNDKLLVNNDGLHGMVEKGASVELPAGLHQLLVTYFDNGGGDGLQVTWAGPGMDKQPIDPKFLAISGGETLHDVAIRSLAAIPGHDAEKFNDLATLIKQGRHQTAAISVLSKLPAAARNPKGVPGLVDNLIGYLTTIPLEYRNGAQAAEATALVKSLAESLPEERAKAVRDRLENLDVRVIAVGTVPERMIYDKEQIVVQAGKPVEFRFSNTDNMPHNFAIVLPGSMEEIGDLAEATARTPDARERHYIPKSDKILLGSKLLEPGQTQSLTYTAPTQPGVYPYVCTYPGHWRRMYGALYVVENLQEYQANPEAYLASHPLEVKDDLLRFTSRNTEWKFADFEADLGAQFAHGRSYDVGKNLFKVANCIACHKLNGEGRELGPDLTKIEPKNLNARHILESLLEPSKEIPEKYQSNTIVLTSGKIVTGMIVEETDAVVKVLVDPLAKADPLAIAKADIDDRAKSAVSIMPKGLLSKLTQPEILDLIGYIYAGGKKDHKIYGEHQHHNH